MKARRSKGPRALLKDDLASLVAHQRGVKIGVLVLVGQGPSDETAKVQVAGHAGSSADVLAYGDVSVRALRREADRLERLLRKAGLRSARDPQRLRVYSAQDSCRKRGEHFASIYDLRDYVEALTSKPWFRKRWSFSLKVCDGRGRYSAAAEGFEKILIPRIYRYELAVLHEVAHACVSYEFREGANHPAGHGPEFCQAFLLLVRSQMGTDASRRLRDLFARHGVVYQRALEAGER